MGRLDAIKSALDAADAAAAAEAAQVNAHFQTLKDQIAALQAQIDQLTANSVSDADIQALADQAANLAATVDAIDTEGDVAPTPEPAPVPEPAPDAGA